MVIIASSSVALSYHKTIKKIILRTYCLDPAIGTHPRRHDVLVVGWRYSTYSVPLLAPHRAYSTLLQKRTKGRMRFQPVLRPLEGPISPSFRPLYQPNSLISPSFRPQNRDRPVPGIGTSPTQPQSLQITLNPFPRLRTHASAKHKKPVSCLLVFLLSHDPAIQAWQDLYI